MPKALTRMPLALAAAALCAWTAAAQTTPEWIALAPAGEGFAARWPTQPSTSLLRVSAAGIEASGRRHAAAGEGETAYAVWSLQDERGGGLGIGAAESEGSGVGAESLYLDRVAEVAWELLVAPEMDRLRRKAKIPRGTRHLVTEAGQPVGMFYARELEVSGKPAREYHVGLEGRRGRVYVTADGARLYVVAALGRAASEPDLRFFNDSFALGPEPNTPGPAPDASAAHAAALLLLSKPDPRASVGSLPAVRPDASLVKAGPPRANAGGGDAPVDYDRPFRHNEVTRKALITYKPEPGYTEPARYFHVTGIVRLRAVLASDGRLKDVSVVKPLPHGLTRKALEAVSRVRFEPAEKDGRRVSQQVVFEYIFNIH